MSSLLFTALVIASIVFVVQAKIFQPCELARDLSAHGVPKNQISTWVCIAQHESSLNTAAVGSLNQDGSKDHGLFQINDRYWCSPPGSGTGCGVTCAQLETADITASVNCARKVFDVTQSQVGNGFQAWTTYQFCYNPASMDNC